MIFIKFMDQNRIKKTCLACIYDIHAALLWCSCRCHSCCLNVYVNIRIKLKSLVMGILTFFYFNF